MNQDLFKELLFEELKNNNDPISNIIRTLLETKQDLGLFNHYMEQYDFEPENWFLNFHKSIRQCDFFDDLVCHKVVNNLTDEQTKRRNELLKSRGKKINEITNLHVDNEDQLLKAVRESEQWKEESKELYSLNGIMRTEEDVPVCAIFDIVFWNLIHIDGKEIIRKTFEKVFRRYAFELKELEIKS